MMGTHTTHRFHFDFWPGFVDALSSLLLVLIFALVIFMVSQLTLSHTLKDTTDHADSLESKLSLLSEKLQVTEQEKSILSTDLQKTKSAAAQDKLSAHERLTALDEKIDELNKQLVWLVETLEASEKNVREKQIQLDDLDQRLNEALAHTLYKLEKYRSDFFEKLQTILGDRSDVKVAGDRFVFQSEVLFPSASAQLSDTGKSKMKKLAQTLKEISKTMPTDLPWILRIDGHTDDRGIKNKTFASNWELSTARAIAVVNFLIKEGIPAKNLAATGFGEHHPIEAGKSDTVRAKNRRIEIKLDQV